MFLEEAHISRRPGTPPLLIFQKIPDSSHISVHYLAPKSICGRLYFPRWPQLNLPFHILFMQCDTDSPPIERWDLCFLLKNQICEYSTKNAMWLPRLGHVRQQFLPGSVGTPAVGTQMPCCEEAQATWRGQM